tara:strand:- start:1847 stop:2065 length:219 start_codon:yes stop_codon:yes gene_type:complete
MIYTKDCGCKVYTAKDEIELQYCPTHEVGPDSFAALQNFTEGLKKWQDTVKPKWLQTAISKANAIYNKVEGL